MNMPLLCDFLGNSAQKYSDKIALYCGEKSYTYGEIFKRASSLANHLYNNGIKKGDRVSPKEIENVLDQLEEIVEARVMPVPNEILGNALKAEVVLRENSAATVDMIPHHCRANLEDIMVPKFVEIVESLPESESGQMLRCN